MCGLSGVLDPSRSTSGEELEAVAAAMSGTLVHRGPDDRGIWTDPAAGVAFGFRRLAIQDVSPAGHQPMLSASGRLVLVFNGEIYDQRDHRKRLEATGARFRGTSDTEVLLECFESWGIERTLQRVTGMFALAVWDRSAERLVLARDRFGEKPLYWGKAGRNFVFGSELRALRAHPAFDARIDRGSLSSYLQLGYVNGEDAILEGVRRLPAATYLTVDRDARVLGIREYWSARSVAVRAVPNRKHFDPRNAVATLDRLLSEVVPSRLIADVPLGAFLSGGIDSTAVVAYAQAASPHPIRTFTMGFDDPRFDERPAARAVASHFGTDHTEVTVTGADALAVVDKLSSIYDEPFADASQIPTYMMCALARREVTVALSGDGGDELFLGYDRYRWARDAWRARAMMPGPVRSLAASGLDHVRSGTRLGSFSVANRPLSQASERIARVVRAGSIDSLYRGLLAHWADPGPLLGEASYGTWDHLTPPWSFPEAAAIVDTLVYLPDDVLVKVDRAAMASSLETRAPLLDQRLFEFAWSLPVEARLKGNVGKRLLRELLARKVPRSLIDRPKRGFGVPLAAWLRGPLKVWGDDLLARDALARDGLFDPDVVCRTWDEHQSGLVNHEHRLWDVLMFQAWNIASGAQDHSPVVDGASMRSSDSTGA